MLRRTEHSCVLRRLSQQLVQARGRSFLPVGDCLGSAPGPGENVGRRYLGGIQVGGFSVGCAVGRRSVPANGPVAGARVVSGPVVSGPVVSGPVVSGPVVASSVVGV